MARRKSYVQRIILIRWLGLGPDGGVQEKRLDPVRVSAGEQGTYVASIRVTMQEELLRQLMVETHLIHPG